MLIESIITLTKMVGDIASKKAELDRRYFEQFIKTTWKAFQTVHQDYKASFKRYTQRITAENADVEAVIYEIRNDARYSSDLRSELQQLVQNIPAATMKTRAAYLSDFIQAIDAYFGTPEEVGTNYYHLFSMLTVSTSNIPRWQALNALTNPEAIPEVVKIFDGIVDELQHKYEAVAVAYYRLRKDLLT